MTVTPLLIDAYRWGTWPYRAAAAEWRRRRRAAPAMVLFYHRVADDFPNDWTITRAAFAKQIEWLAENFELVSLGETQRRIVTGNEQPTVSITFDDGYAENCQLALPLLVERSIPCTYFVTLGNVLSGEPFPHDLRAGRPLRPNSLGELRELAAAGIEIGAHTRTHPDLGAIGDGRLLHDETVAATKELAQLIGRPVRHFAFPFGQPGNLNPRAVELLRAAGLAGICSAYGGYNFPGDDPFHLRRIHGDPLLARLKNWLTVDPRKVRPRHTSTQREQMCPAGPTPLTGWDGEPPGGKP